MLIFELCNTYLIFLFNDIFMYINETESLYKDQNYISNEVSEIN